MVVYPKHYNTIVVGVGGMGSATCYQLAKRGKRVLGLEKFDVPHDMGSSHGYTRIIRLAYYEHPSYVMMLRRAYQLWDEIERLTGEKIFYKTGSIDAGPAESWVFKGSFQSCIEHGIEHEVYTGVELHERFPGYQLPHDSMALYQKDGGFIVPERATVNFVEAAHHYGAEIHGREEVFEYGPTPEGGVRVVTNRAEYTADTLVITAGAWNSRLMPFLRGLAIPERQVLAWLQPERPEHFKLDNFPVFNVLVDEGRFYGFPVYGVPGFKFGKYHHFQEQGEPESFDWEPRPDDEAVLREFADRYFPTGSGPTMSLKACMFTNSPDGHFIIGNHPNMEQVTFAAGFTGHGYKFASVIGEIMADLAERGYTRHDISLFDPERFSRGTVTHMSGGPQHGQQQDGHGQQRGRTRRGRTRRGLGRPQGTALAFGGGRRHGSWGRAAMAGMSTSQQRQERERQERRWRGRRGFGVGGRRHGEHNGHVDYGDTTSPWYWKENDVDPFW